MDPKKGELTKDIQFSNSPVEALNKIMKRYLRHHKPHNFDTLKAVLAGAVEDYNQKRPHGSLLGLTPMEAYTQPEKTLNFIVEKQRAKTLRIRYNSIAGCSTCPKE